MLEEALFSDVSIAGEGVRGVEKGAKSQIRKEERSVRGLEARGNFLTGGGAGAVCISARAREKETRSSGIWKKKVGISDKPIFWGGG